MNPIEQGERREMGPNLGASIDEPSEDAPRVLPIFSTQKNGIEARIQALLSDNAATAATAATATASREQANNLDQAAAGYKLNMSKGSDSRKDSSSKSDSDSARTIESDDPVFAQPASETGYQSEMSQQSSQFSIERNATGEALDAIERHLKDLIKVLSEGYIARGIRKMGTALLFPFRSNNNTQRRAGRKEFKRVITDMETPIRELKEKLEKLGNDSSIPREHQKELINLYAKIHNELSITAVEDWVTDVGGSWQNTTLYRRAQALEMRIKLWEATATEALAVQADKDR